MFLCLKTIGFVALLALVIAVRAAPADERVFIVEMKKGPLSVTFDYEASKKEWADYIEAQISYYLPLAEKYLGKRFPYKDRIKIYSCHDCVPWNQEDWIRLDYYEGETGNPAVLFHELNHFWFRYTGRPRCQDWLIEGIVSFIPHAMREKGILPYTSEYNEEIDNWWGLRWLPPATFHDAALCPFSESKRDIVYIMSYRIQYLLYEMMGPKKWLRFLREYKRIGPHDNRAVIKLLNRFSKKNWRHFLRGWVFRGTYTDVAFSDFVRDQDTDGLSNADEYLHKTKPAVSDTDGDTLPDGAEVELGLNPRQPNDSAAEIIAKNGPFVDGLPAEWTLFSYETESDAAGDSKDSLAWADLTGINLLQKDGVLYLRAFTVEKPQAEEHVAFHLLVDIDDDGHYDHEYSFYLQSPLHPFHYDSALGKSEEIAGLKAGIGEVIEMAVPLSVIPSNSFKIFPIIRNNELKVNYDGWDYWIGVQKQ